MRQPCGTHQPLRCHSSSSRPPRQTHEKLRRRVIGANAADRLSPKQAGFGRKTMASYTPIVEAVRIKASLRPVGVLGHPIFNTNPHAFRLQPDLLGNAMYIARCEHLAV